MKAIFDEKDTHHDLIAELLVSLKVNSDEIDRFKTVEIICEKLGLACYRIEMKFSEYHHQTEVLTDNNEKLEDHMYVSEWFNFSFDLCRLFVYYHIEPLLITMPEYKANYRTCLGGKIRHRIRLYHVIYGP